MTVIVTVTDGSTITMGADSAVGNAASGEMYVSTFPRKIVRLGDDYLVGCCGSLRIGEVLLRAEFPTPTGDLAEHMLNSFLPVLTEAMRRDCEDKGQIWSGDKSDPRETRRCISIGVQGRIFFLSYDLSLIEFDSCYTAMGDARAYAYGALHALRDSDLTSDERVRVALEAAAHYSPSVREPFHVETLSWHGASDAGTRVPDAGREQMADGTAQEIIGRRLGRMSKGIAVSLRIRAPRGVVQPPTSEGAQEDLGLRVASVFNPLRGKTE